MLEADEVLNRLKRRPLCESYASLAQMPHFSLLADMSKATERIVRAIRSGERIHLVGDYDVDGVSATALCVQFFADIGIQLEYTVPDRFKEGYGLSPSIVKRLNADLILTVDNAIMAHESALACKSRGIDLIITDHHTCGATLPEAYAVVNPKRSDCPYPFKDICGAQVAWLLCASLKHALGKRIDMGKYLDLLAVAVVADVMPLHELNRHMVRLGMARINRFDRPFFSAVAQLLGRSRFVYDDLAFQVAPRLNAAGRMAHGTLAVEALLSPRQESVRCVAELDRINRLRKQTQREVTDLVMTMAQGQRDFIVVSARGLHEGVVGIVAAKLAETYGLPAIVLSLNDRGIFKGSGRSVGSVDIYRLVKECEEFLTAFGGHPGACGLALEAEGLEPFSRRIKQLAAQLPADLFTQEPNVMGTLAFDAISLSLAEAIEAMGPYGEGNPKPVFVCDNAEVVGSVPMGRAREHTRLHLSAGGIDLEVPVFNTLHEVYRPGKRVAFSYCLGLNEWQGERRVQVLPQSPITFCE